MVLYIECGIPLIEIANNLIVLRLKLRALLRSLLTNTSLSTVQILGEYCTISIITNFGQNSTQMADKFTFI